MLKKIRVEEAVGKRLLHDITAIKPDGFKGREFKRGHLIQEADIPRLKDIGKDHVFVGELEPGQVHEEDAAKALAEWVTGPNIEAGPPSEGKIALKSQVDGLFVLDRESLDAINSVGDYTLATRWNLSPVQAGDTLVGLRIVPLLTEQDQVDRAVAIAQAGQPVFQVVSYQTLKIGVIITGSEVYHGRIQDRFEPVLRDKFSDFPTEILGFTKCPDDLDHISQALEAYLSQDADLVILTGGMSVDPDDLTPTAIRQSGAQVISQGVPVQPGNMLMLAQLGSSYLLGLPGASIHAPVTSFDTLLPRFYAKYPITKADLIALGEGGLY
ncbi:molybdopterin-binding protein [Hutsoniella sourekii]|uniref:molybdopterin-binding protein n=1 Tax=Hutsoniella sourekii TaxID=87650 RepID=UPI0004890FE2|nr:molybdopterin-binding protein [Hutsoniella sourekii]